MVGSPVESRFVNTVMMVQYIVKSSGVHVDCMGDGKVLGGEPEIAFA